jgi:Site-specific recombinase XerD
MIELSQIADALDFRQDCLNRNLTPKTAKGYNTMTTDYLQFVKPELFTKTADYHAFKPSLIQYHNDLKNERGLTYKTIKTRFTALNNFFEYLYDENVISLNPVPQFRARYVREYKAAEKARYRDLEVWDIETLINNAESRLWRAVIAVFALTGMRREELCTLNIGNVDFDNLMFYVPEHPKRTNERVPFTEQVLNLILDYLELRIS